MKRWALAACLVNFVILAACESDQATQPLTEPTENTIRAEESRAQETVTSSAPEKTATSALTKKKELDLRLHKEDIRSKAVPDKNTQTPLLPNLFTEKIVEKRKFSVGGKLILDDNPNIELRESVQGAQMSIEVRTP